MYGPMYAGVGADDAFGADFPFLALLYPRRYAEVLQGLVNAYDEGGHVPRAPGACVAADAYVKGIRGFDAARAYREMVGERPGPEQSGLAYYKDLGYVPADRVPAATASTLAFAYADFCVARMAQALGEAEDHAYYLARSLSYRNVYDARDGHLKARTVDGAWQPPAEPVGRGTPWAVPHDPQGLIHVMGGGEAFVARLDATLTPPDGGGVAGFEGLRHEPYLYNYAGRPWKTQARVHEAMAYLTRSERLAGGEGAGSLWSWYLFSALGFYPVAPGRPEYVIGRPHFPGVTLHLPGGASFVIEAREHGPENTYIQSALLNGQPLTRSWLSHDDLVPGGVLTFVMGPEPEYGWSSTPEAVPGSVSEPEGGR
jgi:predicted alpha-1,2-mannosidase